MQGTGRSREVGVKSRALLSQAHILMPPDKLGLPCHGQKEEEKKRIAGKLAGFVSGKKQQSSAKTGGKFPASYFCPPEKGCTLQTVFSSTLRTPHRYFLN